MISIWLFVQVELSRVWYYQAIIGLFGLLVLANYLAAQTRWDRPWRTYLFQLCFLALLVAVIILPNPFVESWPMQTRLRFGNFVYVLLFLAPIALTFRPLAMIWAGVCAALAWAIGVAWVALRPESKTYWNVDSLTPPMGSAEALTLFLDPHFVYVEGHVQDVVIVLLMAGVLALVVWRSRRLVLTQIGLARERANLARYFAPTVVDQLAQLDTPLGATRVQPVAVLFADIVGFTRFAESSDPQTVVATLRRLPRQARARSVRPRRHARQVPGRRRDGDLRHPRCRHAGCAQRTGRGARRLRCDWSVERRSCGAWRA